jgi:beta-glucanase (GH16 family)
MSIASRRRLICRNTTSIGLLIAISIAAAPAFAQCALVSNCTLVWSDEFDGTAVDTNNWEFMLGDGSAYGIPGWGNNELQFYTESNASVSNGALTITAREEAMGGLDYTSARLRTLNKGDWTYGRFEMRAKLPVGQGMWPAFWMLSSVPDYGGWAASGEIDIMESRGNNPEQISGTLHYGGEWPENVSSGSGTLLPAGTAQDWHEYAIEWQFGEIRWYLDDQLYATQNNWYSTAGNFPAPFDVNFHLLLNLAVGGYFPGPPDGTTVFPQEYVIDYVRVYGDLPPPTAKRVFDNMEHGNPFSNGWFAFNGGVGGGGLDPNFTDLPPVNGGSASIQTGWGSGGVPGYFGGFGRDKTMDITGMTHFSFWINPDPGQDFVLEFNIQEDDNGDGVILNPDDDEFQYSCVVGPTGPCAISGGGWQLVTVSLNDFVADNSFVYGGNDILDTRSVAAGGNGQLQKMVLAVISNSGADATFRTDYWVFEDFTDTDNDGTWDEFDNCTLVANGPNDTATAGPSQNNTNTGIPDDYGNMCDADFNDNGVVDSNDASVLFGQFGMDMTDPSFRPDVDLNGNGVIDSNDASRLFSTFGQPPGPSGLVPPPSAAAPLTLSGSSVEGSGIESDGSKSKSQGNNRGGHGNGRGDL